MSELHFWQPGHLKQSAPYPPWHHMHSMTSLECTVECWHHMSTLYCHCTELHWIVTYLSSVLLHSVKSNLSLIRANAPEQYHVDEMTQKHVKSIRHQNQNINSGHKGPMTGQNGTKTLINCWVIAIGGPVPLRVDVRCAADFILANRSLHRKETGKYGQLGILGIDM
jgi:hypothetical protein